MNQKNTNYLQCARKYKDFHYTELGPEKLQILHERTLVMLKKVIEILDENKIPYMIVGGTLLGAVTTGKFIPWDDDIDVCVFEQDYERMIDCLIDGLPDTMIVQCDRTEPHYYLGWLKVRDAETEVYPNIPLYKENGVWIDIYKLVPMKENEFAYRAAKEDFDYVKRRYRKGGLSNEEYEERMQQGLEQRLNKEKEKNINKSEGSNVYMIMSASKKMIREEWVFPLKKYNFEGLSVYSLNQPDKYLIEHYGNNYTVLPDDELRRVGITDVTIKNDTGEEG